MLTYRLNGTTEAPASDRSGHLEYRRAAPARQSSQHHGAPSHGRRPIADLHKRYTAGVNVSPGSRALGTHDASCLPPGGEESSRATDQGPHQGGKEIGHAVQATSRSGSRAP
jgi:hypothetical protein